MDSSSGRSAQYVAGEKHRPARGNCSFLTKVCVCYGLQKWAESQKVMIDIAALNNE